MDFPQFRDLVKKIEVGKRLPDAIYTHESALSSVPEPLSKVVLKIADVLGIPDDDWNIIKFYIRDFKLAFLSYPGFESQNYPVLEHSYTVDLAKLSMRKSEYGNSENPPILHRKETFVCAGYPLRNSFEEITAEGESAGLYENPRIIGFKKNWNKLISSKGYFLDEEGRLKRKSDKPEEISQSLSKFDGEVERHRTAIDRNKLSQPMQILARHGYLNGDWSILDYGCGKGDDLRELEAHGLDFVGWDPAHYPEGLLVASDIVNLGFVLNVIEEKEERLKCLRRAWGYTDKLLIVSVMIAGESVVSQFTPFKDGVLTSRKTFQKYYAQSEIRHYLESALSESVVVVAQGIFIVFKDKIDEQTFLLERMHIKRDWQQRTQREIQSRIPTLKKDIIDRNIELFSDFWQVSLDLGRVPANSEFEFSDQIRRIAGSHAKAHAALVRHFGEEMFEVARIKRIEDLGVYFALSLFEKRKPHTHMPESLKRDIKAFYSSYNLAIESSKSLLFSVGDPAVVENACIKAYKQLRCGEFNEGHDFIFHVNYLNDLPTELRVYIGCATQLYGDLEGIQLIKAHITSGKVSLLKYDNWNSDRPFLIERIKIKMREQDVDLFEYTGKFEPQPLENKSIFLQE